MYYIVRFGTPYKAFKTLAAAWLECFDRGFVVKRGRHPPGTTAAQIKHKLDYGIHIIDATNWKKRPEAPRGRGKNKKTKFKTENWIDHL